MMPNSRLMNDSAQGSAAVSDLDDIDGLVQTYRPRVLAFAFYRLRDMDLAETVTQECFMRAFEKRHLFRGDCSVSTWLMAIVANLIRDHTRSARFRFWKMASASAVDPKTMENHRALRQRSPESMLMARDDLRTVWGIVNRFSKKQRAVFVFRFVDEMRLAEIAVRAGITESTVKSHINRAVKAIRKELGRDW
jgi:RNA polymerase sigma-70 factor (ECF subfamily)